MSHEFEEFGTGVERTLKFLSSHYGLPRVVSEVEMLSNGMPSGDAESYSVLPQPLQEPSRSPARIDSDASKARYLPFTSEGIECERKLTERAINLHALPSVKRHVYR